MPEVDKTKPRVVEAEVVRDGEEHTHVEKVEVKRVPGGMFFGRSVFPVVGDSSEARIRVRRLRLKLWLYSLALLLICIACVVGAFIVNTVIVAALLLVLGFLSGVAAWLVFVLYRAVNAITLDFPSH